MIVWRIAKQRYALERQGAGGLREGGRWHHMGQQVIYAGLTVEIATLEKLAHTGSHLPTDLFLVAISVPDDPALYEQHTDAGALPPGWDAIPPGKASADFGADFLNSGRALGLIVASAIVPEASNIVINPLHPAFSRVKLATHRPFKFDQRLGSK